MGVKWLGKLKVHEVAKELGIESKDLIAKAKELGVEVTSHLSSIEEDAVQKIKNSLGKKGTQQNKGVKENKQDMKNKEAKTEKQENFHSCKIFITWTWKEKRRTKWAIKNIINSKYH